MAIQLDHLMVSCHDRNAAARQLAELLGVPFGPARAGAFTSVYVSDSLTIDFDQCSEPFASGHYCFKVNPPEFDAILAAASSTGANRGATIGKCSPKVMRGCQNEPIKPNLGLIPLAGTSS